MATKKKAPPKRSANFVPQLLIQLANHARFECKFTDLPLSYQAQPYNLAAKVAERGGIKANVIFNKDRNTFVMVKIVTSQIPNAA